MTPPPKWPQNPNAEALVETARTAAPSKEAAPIRTRLAAGRGSLSFMASPSRLTATIRSCPLVTSPSPSVRRSCSRLHGGYERYRPLTALRGPAAPPALRALRALPPSLFELRQTGRLRQPKGEGGLLSLCTRV